MIEDSLTITFCLENMLCEIDSEITQDTQNNWARLQSRIHEIPRPTVHQFVIVVIGRYQLSLKVFDTCGVLYSMAFSRM